MDRLPVLPLGQLVVYPHVVLPLAITDPIAVELLDEVVQGNKRLLLAVVKARGGVEPPEGPMMQSPAEALYDVGTLGTMRVMLQGIERAQLVDITEGERWLTAAYKTFADRPVDDAKVEALKRSVYAQFARVIDIAPYLGTELHEVLEGVNDAGKLADFVAANLDIALPAKADPEMDVLARLASASRSTKGGAKLLKYGMTKN